VIAEQQIARALHALTALVQKRVQKYQRAKRLVLEWH
jgi:hypothetical protein